MRLFGLSAVATLIGIAIASVLATENALVIRDRSAPPADAAEDLARRSRSTWQPVHVTASDGAVLQAWLFTPERSNGAAVILLHGVGDTRLGMMGHADFLLRAGYTVLIPDSRGHGASGGALITYGVREAADVRLWAGCLRSRGIGRLYGLGESMGAAILLESLALAPGFRSIVAESPFATFDEVARYRLSQASGAPQWSFWPVAKLGFAYARLRYGVDLRSASPIATVRNARVPILLIHGGQDRNIPIEQSREIAAANSAWVRLWEVPRADHVNAYAVEPERYVREVLGWFDGGSR